MTQPGKFTLLMKSDPRMLKNLSDFILRSAKGRIRNRSAVDDLIITADEIATNIILHAYKRKSDRSIRVSLEISPDRAILSFSHDGQVFQPEKIPKPDFKAPLTERGVNGMGLHIINHLMDQVSYKFKERPDEENVITVIKNIVEQGAHHAS
jgi:anti-sigma regulatory factor (Ser/Thr protein kinase)